MNYSKAPAKLANLQEKHPKKIEQLTIIHFQLIVSSSLLYVLIHL
jgi:hypothetical protein